MSIVDTIHTLNKQLASISKTRNELLAEQKFLKGECEKALEQLKTNTGLDALTAFQSGDVTSAGRIIKAALSKEQTALEEKAELAEKLVQAYEAGDYFAMNELLGIKVEEKSITEEYRESKAESSEEVEPEASEGSEAEVEAEVPVEVNEVTLVENDSIPTTQEEPTKSTAVGEVDDLEGLGIDLSLPGDEPHEEPTTQGTATVEVDDFDFDF